MLAGIPRFGKPRNPSTGSGQAVGNAVTKNEWPRAGGAILKNRSVRHSVGFSIGEQRGGVELLEEISLLSLLKRNFSSTTIRVRPLVVPTFVGLRLLWTRPILSEDRPRLEGVASGYWTLFIKQSSGLVSHYGSSPSSSARPLGARLLML